MSRIFIALLTHNNSSVIETSIKSVLNQTFTDWEMLISDDASNDDTYEKIKPFLKDKRISYVFHKENLKQPRNWEYALKKNESPIIATLHADDEWTLYTLEKINSIFENDERCDLVWGNWEFFNQDFQSLNKLGPVTAKCFFDNSQDALSYLAVNNMTLPSATFISKYVLNVTGYPNSRLEMLCDREFFLRIANNSRNCQSLPFVLCNYRINSYGVSATFTKNFKIYDEIYEFALDFENIASTHPGRSQLAKNVKQKLAKILLKGLLDAKNRNNVEYQGKISKYMDDFQPYLSDLFKFKIKNFLFNVNKINVSFVKTNLKILISEYRLFICNSIVSHLPFHFLRLLYYRKVMGFVIGKNSAVFMNCKFDCAKKIEIGHNSVINANCRLDNRGIIKIGNNVSISQNVVILTADHDVSSQTLQARIKTVEIMDYSFIGTRATVLPGVTIFKGGVAAACSLVNKDIPENTVVGGVPAKVIKYRNQVYDYTVYYKRLFQ
jgi:acetyltransferase-like isoleucine patch superfamily enzyme